MKIFNIILSVVICLNNETFLYSFKCVCNVSRVGNTWTDSSYLQPGVSFCHKYKKSIFLTMTASITTVLAKFYEEYAKTTPSKLKLIDAYLLYIVLTGVVQFLYCCLVGTFPFNSFLSGFISCVGSFVLAGKPSFC